MTFGSRPRWLIPLVVGVVAGAIVLGVVVLRRPTSWACTAMGGSTYEVATADEAFDRWWERGGPEDAHWLAVNGYPQRAVGVPSRADFVASEGHGGPAGWHWELGDGVRISVQASKAPGGEGWDVASNHCTTG